MLAGAVRPQPPKSPLAGWALRSGCWHTWHHGEWSPQAARNCLAADVERAIRRNAARAQPAARQSQKAQSCRMAGGHWGVAKPRRGPDDLPGHSSHAPVPSRLALRGHWGAWSLPVQMGRRGTRGSTCHRAAPHPPTLTSWEGAGVQGQDPFGLQPPGSLRPSRMGPRTAAQPLCWHSCNRWGQAKRQRQTVALGLISAASAPSCQDWRQTIRRMNSNWTLND